MRNGRTLADEQAGFTLVELMVAALVLIVGMLSIATMLQRSLSTTNLNNQRVAATNLARELTEAARQGTYAKLTPTQIAGELQTTNPNLAKKAGATNWDVVRRGITYTITATACTFDDPADKIAASAPANKCADNPGGTTGDQNGDDFRRVTFSLAWKTNTKPHTFKQAALIVNPSGGLGPRITSFTGPSGPVNSGTTAHFDVVTTDAASVHWNADDGVSLGDATGGPKNWAIDWNLKAVGTAGAVLDGTYSLIAQAFDTDSIAGDSKIATVAINRSLPFAPTPFQGGHDTRAGDWVDFEWSLNAERDIIGYRVYWVGPDNTAGTADDARVCPAPAATSSYLPPTATVCRDTTPPAGAATYYVVAIDTPLPATTPREGAKTLLTAQAPGAQPAQPAGATITGVDVPTLDWTAPGSGSVAFYRIYRDGTSWSDRYAATSTLSFTDNSAGPYNQYWISSVDSKYQESALLGPLEWVP